MERYKYLHMKLEDIPDAIINSYKLMDKKQYGFIYCEVRKEVYGLLQAGLIAIELLEKSLNNYD